VDAEELARRFHEAYERLAPVFNYQTRRETAVPWDEVPEQNKRLMIAVCAELLAQMCPASPDSNADDPPPPRPAP
jgi:hypothetical protein